MSTDIRIYNSLSRKKEKFKPLKKGRVGIYICGPTVYDEPHIGHIRSAYVFDVIRKYFEYKKYKVKFIRNITDLDDKIINKAKEEFGGEDLKKATQKVATKYFESYRKCMDKLGIKPPTKEPKATEYITKMGKFIAELIKRGIAYKTGDGVYFDITKAKGYGKLSNQSIEALAARAILASAARIALAEGKKNPLDFVLWKKAKEGEPSWHSSWGEGRPGWHIECSVMSSDILGDEFDIHGGGIDLIFPHHENEFAQSKAAGKKFARYWIHNGLLTINEQKMAKSLGNFVTINEIEKKGYPPEALKLLFLQAHYSHPVDFSWDKLKEMKAAYERVVILMGKIKTSPQISKDKPTLGYRQQFIEAMDDNFNTPRALAVLFDLVSHCNKLLEQGKQNEQLVVSYGSGLIREIGNVFGLNFAQKNLKVMSVKEIEREIRLRSKYRKQGKFKQADQIRKALEKKGIILEDTKKGTLWRRRL